MNLVTAFARRPDYHQLPSYAKVMQEIGWKVVTLKSGNLFVKQLGPVAFAKLQRANAVDFKELSLVQRRLHMLVLYLEPGLSADLGALNGAGFKSTNTHYAYTKTLIVDLTPELTEVLASFSKTTAYQMRRSLKVGVEYQIVPFQTLSPTQKQATLDLHRAWSSEKHVAGYEDNLLEAIWKHMSEGVMIFARKNGQLHGALFLLMHHKVGMYFYQFSSKQGRHELYVPSGLAYQSIRLAKERGCDIFDLCSAYDERYKENAKWKGFSKYKERFHPTPVYYPQAYRRLILPRL